MKCANCNAEIKDGSIYCSVCGKEAQMVNASLEDDVLHSLLREGIQPLKAKKKRMLSPEEELQEQKRKQRMPIFITCLILAVLIAIGVVIKLFVDYKNDNSYEYQINMAEREMVDHNYESAIEYYARALAIVPDDIDCRLEMAKIYLLREQYDAAIVLLTETVRLDNEEAEAYQYLIDIYAEKGLYSKIQDLAEYADDKEIKKLFADYLVSEPTIYPTGDTFYTELDVTMVSVDDCAIYYTIDGSDPIENGKRYIKGVGIELESSGLYTIRAVCKNENNIYSKEIKQEYQIVLMPEEDTEIFSDGMPSDEMTELSE